MKKFAFIVHPRTIDDFGRRVGKALRIGESLGIKITPKRLSEWFIGKLRGRLSFTVISHFQVSPKVEGYLVGVMLTSHHMLTLPRRLVQTKIINACLYAQNKLHVKYIGLGAYTAPMTLNGRLIAKDKRIHSYITHGDALSAASVIPAVKEALLLKKSNIESSIVAVVGAYGVVGRGVAILLSELGPKSMILIGPNINKLKAVKETISKNYLGNIYISNINSDIRAADIVILCTTANGSIVTSRMLKENCIVIDMAQPHNMSREVSMERPDVLRIDGGYMSTPGVDIKFDMGLPKYVSFACFVETMLSAILDVNRHDIGAVDTEYAKYLLAESYKYGYTLAPLTNFSEPIKQDI